MASSTMTGALDVKAMASIVALLGDAESFGELGVESDEDLCAAPIFFGGEPRQHAGEQIELVVLVHHRVVVSRHHIIMPRLARFGNGASAFEREPGQVALRACTLS